MIAAIAVQDVAQDFFRHDANPQLEMLQFQLLYDDVDDFVGNFSVIALDYELLDGPQVADDVLPPEKLDVIVDVVENQRAKFRVDAREV